MNNKKVIIISLIFIVLLTTIITIGEEKMTNLETSIEGKEISKEDYLYKSKLLDLGYTINEIKTIENKISISDVKNYLLNKKFENLLKFIYSPYFKASNTERYENYYNLHNDYDIDKVTMDVEIGIDNDFYTNIKELIDYKSSTALINKYYVLNEDAEFNDLVTIDEKYSNGTQKIRKVAYKPLLNMIGDAKKDNISLTVVSSFRTYDRQLYLFNNSVNKNGIEHALKYSAKPGHSEHQLGLAVDLNSVDPSFEKTKEYEWLKNNSYKYGFILRYQKDKENITGFAYEPWHYRYVGIDAATKMFEKNLSLEEYYVKYSK